MSWEIRGGDCLERMRSMDEASIDAIVCDPPYGIRFMGKAWDGADIVHRTKTQASKRERPDGRTSQESPASAAGTYDFSPTANQAFQGWCEEWSREVLRALKPGGHLLAFGGTRTYHRLACAIEDAGFEIRDSLIWLYGSGFPKSHNGGWGGTALKPGHEPIVVGRKPLEGTVAENFEQYGTGALNIDGCRIEGEAEAPGSTPPSSVNGQRGSMAGPMGRVEYDPTRGRWPANVLLDEQAAAELDEQSGELVSNGGKGAHRIQSTEATNARRVAYSDYAPTESGVYGDRGGASRFFYCAKASRGERNAGLDGFDEKPMRWSDGEQSPGTFQAEGTKKAARNAHPTVKPIDLMRWLVRLVTPGGGLVLDPFTGSGTTGVAAVLEGFDFIGIERESEYAAIAQARIEWWAEHEGEDTAEVLVSAGLSERIRREREERGQMGLLDEAA